MKSYIFMEEMIYILRALGKLEPGELRAYNLIQPRCAIYVCDQLREERNG